MEDEDDVDDDAMFRGSKLKHLFIYLYHILLYIKAFHLIYIILSLNLIISRLFLQQVCSKYWFLFFFKRQIIPVKIVFIF